MTDPEIKHVTEKLQQGTNSHIYWCTAKPQGDGGPVFPCLMIKESALELGLKLDLNEETKAVIIEGPRELMVSLMQDLYTEKDGKPFKLSIERSCIRSMTKGEDYIAFIMNDDLESWDTIATAGGERTI